LSRRLSPTLAVTTRMTYRNTINLTEAQLDKPVYRIMSVNRISQTLRDKQLGLAKPRLWDDPFENALLASEFKAPDGSRAHFSAKDAVYGQCWTLHRETDAMWRIYSPDKDGVRVTSTPRKLLDALAKSDPKYWKVRAFIGKVTYKKKTDLIAALQGIHLTDTNGSGVAESLLYKRNEFRHEAEVRLIYSGPDGNCPEDIYPVVIEPDEIFDKMVFDPRMDIDTVKKSRTKLKSLGFNGRITQSSLYQAPTGLVFHL
jgi:hypothetical protein